MALNKRSKISAEFSMSSLTDIIFLLLIFFMLTSTLVRIQPFELPKSDSKTVAATDVVVEIRQDGTMKLNGVEIQPGALEGGLRTKVSEAEKRENVTVTIVAETGTQSGEVIRVMDIANRLRAKAIIATQPES